MGFFVRCFTFEAFGVAYEGVGFGLVWFPGFGVED